MSTRTELPELLTTQDLRALLRVGRTAVYDITRRADFPEFIPVGGTYRWYRHEVLAWLDAQRGAERPVRVVRDVQRVQPPQDELPLVTTRPLRRRAS